MDNPMQMPEGFRTPPCNIDAEQAVLGAILINNEAFLKTSRLLEPDTFYEPVHRRIYAEIARVISEDGLADPITLRRFFLEEESLREVGGAAVYLRNIAQAATSIADATHYAKLLRDLYQRRCLIAAAEAAVNEAYDPASRRAFGDIKADLQLELDRHGNTSDESLVLIRDVIAKDLVEHIEHPPRPIPTGFAEIDESMGNGLQIGLSAVNGQSKNFKSGLLGSVFHTFLYAQDAPPAAYITLEMSPRMIIQRLVGGYADMDYRDLETPSRYDDAMAGVAMFAANHPGADRCYAAHVPGISGHKLIELIRYLVITKGIKVIMLDYLQRVTGGVDGWSHAQYLEWVTRSIANIADKECAYILAASQLNRQNQVLGSGGLTRDCVWSANIHTKVVDGPQGDKITQVWLDVTESRFGRKGPIGTEEAPIYRLRTGPRLERWH